MHYLTDITREQLSAIQGLIRSGRFDSVQEFIQVALDNQLFLESAQSGPFQRGSLIQEKPSSTVALPSAFGAPDKLLVLDDREPLVVDDAPIRQCDTLWGLYNRIFPVKIAVRIIANLGLDSGNPWVELKEASDEASKRARHIGRTLADADEEAGRIQGEKLSTALPISSHEKALARYQNMFVGRLTSGGTSKGMPVDLGLVIIKGDKNNHAVIGLTSDGAAFARLTSPILDVSDSSPRVALSPAETNFYLSHVAHWLPSEHELYLQILSGISSGQSTPELLDTLIKAKLKHPGGEPLSTERAGFLSRLTELDLVKRKRDGLWVSYSLSNRGNEYLRQVLEAKVS